MKQKFNVTGMTCSACSAHVEKSVKKLQGIKEVNVNLLQNSMTVDYDESLCNDDKIVEAVVKGGYGASVKGAKKENATSSVNDEVNSMKRRVKLSFLFLIPLFYISMGHMMGFPLPEILVGHENIMVFSLTQMILTLPIMYINRKYFQVGFKTLIMRSPNMDPLVALGSTSAFVYSLYAILQMGYHLGHSNMQEAHKFAMELYFESAGMILALITLGKYLEARSKGRTKDAIAKLMDLSPKTAIVERDGVEMEIPSAEVVEGDIIIVKSGKSIPADGVIIEGNGSVDESAITGESIPVEKNVNDKVIGATVNKAGYFKFKATKVGEDTALSQIIKLVEEASGSKAPIAKLADKVSGVFVPIVIVIAIISAIYWLVAGQSFAFALSIGIAVLVISCPCGLGLATPTAIMVGTGKGAENGILIKSAESLEIAHLIDTVILDKTGTVTEGKPKVTDVILADGVFENKLLRPAYAIEKASEHPLAESIIEYCNEKNVEAKSIENFKAVAGQGVYGDYEGKKVYSGNLKMMNENGIDTKGLEKEGERLSKEGKTPMYFAYDNKILGIIAVADVIKPTSAKAIQEFINMGIDVYMLTGDNKNTALAIGKQAGVPNIIAEVLPQDKEREVRRIQEMGKKVAMIGDGINDAPALARADVGIAIGAGTDIAIESADIVLMKSDLMDSVYAVKLSKAVIRNVKENLFWAFFYNVIGIPLACGVLYNSFGLKLNPMFGAAAMSLSSLFVVSNALRLKFFKPKFKDYNKEENKEEKENVVMEKTIIIEGMMCSHCTGRVDKALNDIDGVKATVSLDDKSAHCVLSKDIDEEVLVKAVTDAGYKVIDIK